MPPIGLITLACTLAYTGRGEDAIRQAKTAMRLNPHAPWYYTYFAGFAHYAAKQFDKAAAAFDRTRQLNPRTPLPLLWSAAANAQLGSMKKAHAAREAYMKRRPDWSISVWMKRSRMKGEFRELYMEGLRKAGFPENPPFKLPNKPSIAVLPFTNMSDDKEQEYFSDGITEDIITDLSKVSGLIVIARNSSFKYKGKSVDVRDVARDLGVQHVLEGSVRRSADKLRITAQLIDATTGNHIWAERYDRGTKNIFAIQDEIARTVVAELAVTLKADEQERLYRRHTDNLEAYETYLQAQRIMLVTKDAEKRAERKRLFERVTELDPNFAGGYAGLSFIYTRDLRYQRGTSRKKSIERALALAHRAVATMQQAVRVQPNDAEAHRFLGYYLHWSGRGDDAIRVLNLAQRLDPKSGGIVSFLGMANVTAGHYEDAISALEQGYARRARQGQNSVCFLAAAYAATGQDEKARAAVKAYLNKNPKQTLSNYQHPRIYKRPEDRDRYLNLLRKAGMPE